MAVSLRDTELPSRGATSATCYAKILLQACLRAYDKLSSTARQLEIGTYVLESCPAIDYPVFFFDGAIFGDFDPDRMIASRYKDFAAFRFKGF